MLRFKRAPIRFTDVRSGVSSVVMGLKNTYEAFQSKYRFIIIDGGREKRIDKLVIDEVGRQWDGSRLIDSS